MIRKLWFLALMVPLAGCDWGYQSSPPPRRPPATTLRPHSNQPVAWLDPIPYCEGSLRRGEWLVCDNKGLNWLHRTLASQWAEERQGADRQTLWVQRQQLQALLTERAACGTSECVATAYRRYLNGKSRWTPEPDWRPAPPRPAYHPPRKRRINWRDNAESCASKIGWQRAALLSRQCEVVNPDGQCGPQRSCATLKTMVLDGCWEMGERKPGFCSRT